ncbi:MAG: hypothetical protein AUK09_01920 [Parcubacteria group bacterium CG2_30_36_38]|nr:MAG: hypothetical protein AUK09_01920 [Parcubacteria group bacterium CG2_30_36_38]
MNYNQLYQQNKKTWSEQPNQLLKLARQDFVPGSYFLDLGCGQGKDALFVVKNGFKVTAVDLSEVAIKQLQATIIEQNLKNIEAIQSDVKNFVIEKDVYDIIQGNHLLQFLPKPVAIELIKDVQQKVKLNGFIILASFTIDDPSFKLPQPKKISTYFEPQEMLRLFDGFKIIHYIERVILDQGHGGVLSPHQHGVVEIIAQKR